MRKWKYIFCKNAKYLSLTIAQDLFELDEILKLCFVYLILTNRAKTARLYFHFSLYLFFFFFIIFLLPDFFNFSLERKRTPRDAQFNKRTRPDPKPLVTTHPPQTTPRCIFPPNFSTCTPNYNPPLVKLFVARPHRVCCD
jgi:hypothetical protein